MRINLTEYLDDTAKKVPEKIAVIDQERKLSFQSLEKHAKGLANILIEKLNAIANIPVGVFLEKSIESIVADISILYSGNAYMNLDVKTPPQRLDGIIKLVHPVAIITTSKWEAHLPELPGNVKVIRIDEYDLKTLTYDEAVIQKQISSLIDTDPLCLINTSGSTGTPKSVVLNHRSFIDYTSWAIDTLHLKEDEILGSLAPIVFDHFSYELCLLMICGCTLVILPEMYASFPAKLMQYTADMKITYIFWVPTIMVNIANMDLLTRIPQHDLRMIWFAGEVFPTKQFNYWRKCLPNATFVNLYGPTEITVDCTYYVIKRDLKDEEPIPIGYACKNTNIMILNQNNEIAKPGEEGELCVRGTSLAMGYYNNPEKTAAAFVQNPLNHSYPEFIYRTGDIVYVNQLNEIVFKGRNDTLIKHMGKRIELGEIEHIIVNTLGLVQNACALYDYNAKEIVLFYESSEEFSVGILRKKLSESLPNYMIPTKYIYMSQMPRNTNGKIDRFKLKEQLIKISASSREV